MGAKTAKQQDALTELLDLLTQNGKKQEAAELSALFEMVKLFCNTYKEKF